MIIIQLPNREPLMMSDAQADLLYGALWDNATAVRGSVTAAAQIKRALSYLDRMRKPLVFDGLEATAVRAALRAPRARAFE